VTESSAKIDKLDETVPQGVASSVSSLRAFDFADGAPPSESGLDHPAYSITTRAGPKTVTLLVGKIKNDNYYVKKADSDQVFLVAKFTIERLAKPPVDFRDKTMSDIKADEVVALDINYGGSQLVLEKSGNDWKAKKPAALAVDNAKVTPIAQAFASWKAGGFAETVDPKATGLKKPTARITVHTKSKKSVTFLVGALKDEDYFVQVAGRPDVFVVKKFGLERILKKPDDVKKSEATAKKS